MKNKTKEHMCENCDHPKWLHHDDELNLGVHCSAYAEAAVADCDCPGYTEPA